MSENPTISVTMPVYNRADLVRDAVESILSQTEEDFEFIIVDDGSEDETPDIIRSYKDARIRFFQLPANCGGPMARNVAMKMARGQFLAVMDSDDVAMPGRLAAQRRFLEEHPEVHFLGSNVIKDVHGRKGEQQHRPEDGVIKARLLMMNGSAMLHPTMMARLDFLRDNKLLYPMMERDQDHGLWIEAMYAGARFQILQETLLTYRRHGGNVTAHNPEELQARKTPHRAHLLARFYPNLTRAEVWAIARIMEQGRRASAPDICSAVAAVQKALLENRTFFGEDKAELKKVLRHFASNALRSITGDKG